MTRIAILNDIHGNFTALSICLKSIKKINPDLIVIPGDLIGIGPDSNSVVKEIMKLDNTVIVRGNHENYVKYGFHNPASAFEETHHLWQKEHLDSDVIDFINKLEFIKYIDVEGKRIAVTHYARANDKFTPIYHNLTNDLLDQIYNYINADIIIYGHEHNKDIRKTSKSYYINIGSLGCNNFNIGFTKFGLLTINKDDVYLDEYYLEYNAEVEIKKLYSLNVPDHEFITSVFIKKEK